MLCGCATNKAFQEKRIEQKTELFTVYENREDLQGYRREEILQRFGQPDLTKESSVYENVVTIWYYKDIYYNTTITFVNDIVTEVEYR